MSSKRKELEDSDKSPRPDKKSCLYIPSLSEFSDLIITIDKVQFPVHRVKLAECSSVLRETLVQDRECKELDLTGRTDHSVESVALLLRAIYGRLPTPTYPEAKLLVRLAHFYNCEAIVDQCSQVIETQSQTQTLLEDLGFAHQRQLPRLQRGLFTRVRNNLKACCVAVPKEQHEAVYGGIPAGVLGNLLRTACGLWSQQDSSLLSEGNLVQKLVDAQDSSTNWFHGVVKEEKNGKYLVHFIGWGPQWDEWLPIDSSRIAGFATVEGAKCGAEKEDVQRFTHLSPKLQLYLTSE